MNNRFRALAFALIVMGVSGLADLDYAAETGGKTQGGHSVGVDARYGGVYRAPLLNNPMTLDPAYKKDIYSEAVARQVFDGLVQFSSDLFVIPALAETWQVEENGKTYRFILREDARFHNDRRVTSKDVVFSLSRLLRVSPPATIFPHLLKIAGAKEYVEHKSDQVAGLRVLDERTLLIQLEQPHAPFLIALGMSHAMIVPPEEVNGREDLFSRRPVGTGPFKFVTWQDNQIIRLERFPQYFGGPAFLDEVAFVIYPGGQIQAVLDAFKKKTLQEMPVYAQVREKLSGEKGLFWIHRPSLSLLFYGINCQHPNLSNRELRNALSMPIDRKQLVERVYQKQFEPAYSILPPGLPGYRPRTQEGLDGTAAEVDRLRNAKGGGTFPRSIEVVSNSQSPMAQAELGFVREAWAKLGIALEPKFIPDWTEFEKYLKSDSLQLYRYVWYADMPDPDGLLQPLFSVDSDANFMRYRDERVNDMLQKARETTNPLERARIYQDIEETVLKSQPIIPLFNLSVDSVYQPAVQGVEVSALGAHNVSFHRVWLDSSKDQ